MFTVATFLNDTSPRLCAATSSLNTGMGVLPGNHVA